ncbi:MAG: protein kinase [Clostridia bacterium]|nr:protein kinase [Clostridia bacterium]
MANCPFCGIKIEENARFCLNCMIPLLEKDIVDAANCKKDLDDTPWDIEITREAYLEKIFQTYRLVNVLSNKNNSQALRLRHRTLEKDLVLHSFSNHYVAYDALCPIRTFHLPEIYESVHVTDGQIVLEEYIDGMNVAQIMEVERYTYKDAKKVLRSVCEALSILHRLKIVHRDVKPENVLVTPNGRVVLIDFNASREMKENSLDTVIMGTVGYASPEQMGITQSDSRTDIYAVGVLLNVMLTGKHPSDVLVKRRPGRIVQKCTQINPDLRYQDAMKLAKAL